MLTRGLIAAAIATVLLFFGAAPAQAIPPGDSLIVFAYFDSPAKQNLVGQRWSGCGQPSGSWGTTSPYSTLYFTPC
jgi:hypothetical protein